MALYVPHSIFHLVRLLYVRPETFGPYYILYSFFVFPYRIPEPATGPYSESHDPQYTT